MRSYSKSIAVLGVAAACTLSAYAGTIVGGSAVPAQATLGSTNTPVIVKYTFGANFSNKEKVACGAKLKFSDGRPPELIPINTTTSILIREYPFSTPGTYTLTFSGYAFGGMVACTGSAIAMSTLNKAIAATPMPFPANPVQQPATGAIDNSQSLKGAALATTSAVVSQNANSKALMKGGKIISVATPSNLIVADDLSGIDVPITITGSSPNCAYQMTISNPAGNVDTLHYTTFPINEKFICRTRRRTISWKFFPKLQQKRFRLVRA